MGIGRMYAAIFEEVTVSAIQDLFELVAAADSVVIVHSLEISQSSDTDSEMLNLIIHRGSTSGSGGSSVTPTPLQVGAQAFGGTCEANNTSQSTEGAILHAACFNVLNGYLWTPTPECRPVLSPSGRLIVELQTAPGDALTMSGTLVFEELGG